VLKDLIESLPESAVKKMNNYKEKKDSLSAYQLARHLIDIKMTQIIPELFHNILPIKISSDAIESYGMLMEIYCFWVNRHYKKDEAINIIQDLIERDYTINGESYWYFHHRAHIADNLKRNPFESDMFYALAAVKAKGLSLYHITNGIYTIRPDEYVRELITVQGPKFLNRKFKIMEYYSTDIYKDCVYLVCADANYFRLYSELLLNSVIEMEPENIVVHFHIINPDQEGLELAEKLTTLSRVNYSVEYIDFPDGMSDRSKIAYYTTPRYTLIPELMDCYGTDFIVTDIDVSIKEKWNNFLGNVRKHDLALSSGILSQQNYYPWTRVSAGLAYFGNNSLSRLYLKIVKNYITTVFDFSPSGINWLIDQNALWKAYKVLNLAAYNERVGKINLAMLVNLAQNHPKGKKGLIQEKQ